MFSDTLRQRLLVFSIGLIAMTTSYIASADTIDDKVDALLAKMTLPEKIGQMNQYNGFWDVTGPAPSEGDAEKKFSHLTQGLVGSVLNVSGVEQVRELQKLVVEESRLGIPLMFGLDVIHGHKTLSPIPLAEAASWDLQAIEKSARVAAIESSARGINWTFAPMVDISRDARWGRVMEGAGEDTYLGQKVGVARVKGFQGEDLSKPDTIAATAKHLAGYGFSEAGRDYNLVDVGNYTLYNVILPPFKSAVDAGVKTVMNSFNTLNGVPATASKLLQRDILKTQWGFDGFIISDWASTKEMIYHGYSEDLKHAAEQAVKAGSDMDMESYAYVNHLQELVQEGKVKESHIDDAVRRILKVKFELGLFDDPYRYVDDARETEQVYNAAHSRAALDMAKRSIVMLKNEQNLLPLSKEQKKIAVIGPLAEDKNSPLGSWRIGSDDNTAVSLLEGLANYTHDISYQKGADFILGEQSFIKELVVNESDTSGFPDAVALAKESDVVIMMLGEHGFHSGEARSRTKLDFPGVQQELLEAVYAVNKNIVLLVQTGRPLVLDWAEKHIPSILVTWQLGSQSGNAIAKVLFGDYNPSGKLPMSFPRSVGQVPLYYNVMQTGRPVTEGTVFWSHYIDERNDALFPFGHGLSYSHFTYSNLRIDDSNKKAIKVTVDVTNDSAMDGEEVVQLYIRDRVASLTRPIKELKGFEKISLKAAETESVQFTLTDDELGFYQLDGNFVVENGDFDVMVGTSSMSGIAGEFRL